MKTYTNRILFAFLIFGALQITLNNAHANSVKNLERERAHLVNIFLDPSLDAADRQNKLESTKPRLIDLERMVLRDDSLKGRNTPIVRKAFANYDLTFLVHASSENNQNLFDQWLEQVGLTTDGIISARKARR
jgi:hypothetical protein